MDKQDPRMPPALLVGPTGYVATDQLYLFTSHYWEPETSVCSTFKVFGLFTFIITEMPRPIQPTGASVQSEGQNDNFMCHASTSRRYVLPTLQRSLVHPISEILQ